MTRDAAKAGPDRLERIATARRNFVFRAGDDKNRLLSSHQRWLEGVEAELLTIRSLAHRLRGTAGSYGFMATSRAAADLELLAQESGVPSELAAPIQRLIEELENMRADDPS